MVNSKEVIHCKPKIKIHLKLLKVSVNSFLMQDNIFTEGDEKTNRELNLRINCMYEYENSYTYF